jgi:hypothetical protein
MKILLRFIIIGFLHLCAVCVDAQPRNVLQKAISVEIARPITDSSLLHWKITNKLDVAVYVYDFFLWGPAYHVEQAGDRVTIETTPVKETQACPPNRFPPVLLLVIGPNRTIAGDFSDPVLNLKDKTVSLKISVGGDPYSVVEEAKQFANSKCKHSPYDAIVRWGAIVESNTLELP